jgi:hypothetical protein
MSGLWKGMKEARKVPGDLGGKFSLEYGDNHESNHFFGFLSLDCYRMSFILPFTASWRRRRDIASRKLEGVSQGAGNTCMFLVCFIKPNQNLRLSNPKSSDSL